MIQFGCCLPGGNFIPAGEGEFGETKAAQMIAGCRYLEKLGYDYAELAAGRVCDLTLEECREIAAAGVHILAVNCIVPFALAGKDKASDEKINAHFSSLFEKCGALGMKYAVFGSGGARRCPEGYSEEERLADIENFLKILDGIVGRNGMRVIIEPLNTNETDFINTFAEGAEFSRHMQAIGCRNIGVLADSYHTAHEGRVRDADGHITDPNEDALALFGDNLDILWHCHIAEPFDRGYPFKHDGAYAKKFIAELNRVGYDGGITVECSFGDFTSENRIAVAGMKSAL